MLPISRSVDGQAGKYSLSISRLLGRFPSLTKIRLWKTGKQSNEIWGIWLLTATAKPDYCEGSWRKTGGKDAIQLSGCGIVLLGGHKKAEKAATSLCPEKQPVRSRLSGGGRGIRTPDTLSGISVFKTDCFNRSHIPPRGGYQQFIRIAVRLSTQHSARAAED